MYDTHMENFCLAIPLRLVVHVQDKMKGPGDFRSLSPTQIRKEKFQRSIFC